MIIHDSKTSVRRYGVLKGQGEPRWLAVDTFSIELRWEDQDGRVAGSTAADRAALLLSKLGVAAPDIRRMHLAISGAVHNLAEAHQLKQQDISITIHVSVRANGKAPMLPAQRPTDTHVAESDVDAFNPAIDVDSSIKLDRFSPDPAVQQPGASSSGYGFFLVIRDVVSEARNAGSSPPKGDLLFFVVELFLYPEGR